MYFCLHHKVYKFLSILGHFGCFAAYFLIFLQFLSGVQKYVWKDVIHMVVLAIKKNQTFLFQDYFVKEHIVLLSKSRRASKSQYWFKSYADVAERVGFVYWWSFSGRGSTINGASPSSFDLTTLKTLFCGKVFFTESAYWSLAPWVRIFLFPNSSNLGKERFPQHWIQCSPTFTKLLPKTSFPQFLKPSQWPSVLCADCSMFCPHVVVCNVYYVVCGVQCAI